MNVNIQSFTVSSAVEKVLRFLTDVKVSAYENIQINHCTVE